MPAATDGAASSGGRRPKASKGRNRGNGNVCGCRDTLWGFERRGWGICEVARRPRTRLEVVALDQRLGVVEPTDFERCSLIALRLKLGIRASAVVAIRGLAKATSVPAW